MRYIFSYFKVTGQFCPVSKFRPATSRPPHGQIGVFYMSAYPDTGLPKTSYGPHTLRVRRKSSPDTRSTAQPTTSMPPRRAWNNGDNHEYTPDRDNASKSNLQFFSKTLSFFSCSILCIRCLDEEFLKIILQIGHFVKQVSYCNIYTPMSFACDEAQENRGKYFPMKDTGHDDKGTMDGYDEAWNIVIMYCVLKICREIIKYFFSVRFKNCVAVCFSGISSWEPSKYIP